MAILKVGSGEPFSTISSAVAASQDGDVIQVQAGTYTNDFATINTKITLQGVGGMVKMVGSGAIPNDKGILITNTDVTIDRFEFSGAEGDSGNSAGIRYQGGHLTITNSYFHHNQNGLLANPVADGTITIRSSEFAHNGTGDGRTHNLYVSEVGKLIIENSYFHDISIGHQIKSRALETVITGSRIYDNDGDASYSIDLPNGGKALIAGNIIQQGPEGRNSTIITFGVEGAMHHNSSIHLSDNSVLNDLGRGILLLTAGGAPATIDGARLWGVAADQIAGGSGAAVTSTSFLPARPALDTAHPWSTSGPPPLFPLQTPTAGDDSIVGAPGDDAVSGGAGNDTISGQQGSDALAGDDGFDLIYGGEGADTVRGGADSDTVNGNEGEDSVTGDAGADVVYGGQGSDRVEGGAGDDSHVNGNRGADVVRGGEGDDTVYGGQDDDSVYGDDGDDRLSGDLGNDALFGGPGADRFAYGAGGGADWAVDFDPAAGDRVLLASGSAYTLKSHLGQTILELGAGSSLGLAGVSSFDATWVLFG